VSIEGRVKDHFDADAARFDAIYDDRKSAFARFMDDVWRGVVRRRYELVLKRLGPLEGKSVLDVGCGSGRYCLAYAQRGAARVVGVDFAAAMIELARRHAQQLGVADRCEFRVGTFPEAVTDGPFDVSTAMGFFDYVADPVPIVARMRELTRTTMILSFPKAWEWRVPFRRLRFLLAGCPLFLYSASSVREILTTAGVERCDWIELDRDYIVVASTHARSVEHSHLL
jgi:2-polyprenyl-3-methyl-5-hydroxy-6-metoxy-1,4-benzoquinol methylase